MLEFKMPITVKVKAAITVDTPFGDGSVNIWGPVDTDKDGNPEVMVKVDLPGKALDTEIKLEVPFADLLGAPIDLAMKALAKSDIPGAAFLMQGLKALLT